MVGAQGSHIASHRAIRFPLDNPVEDRGIDGKMTKYDCGQILAR